MDGDKDRRDAVQVVTCHRFRSKQMMHFLKQKRIIYLLIAEVAELADALGSGSSGRKAVRVQIPPSAPNKLYIKDLPYLYNLNTGAQVVYNYVPFITSSRSHCFASTESTIATLSLKCAARLLPVTDTFKTGYNCAEFNWQLMIIYKLILSHFYGAFNSTVQ